MKYFNVSPKWIPAFAGMTTKGPGMTTGARMTKWCTVMAALMLSLSSSTLFALLQNSAQIGTTTVATSPLEMQIGAKPNIIFVLDDSGSMDFETLLETNDGALWYDDSVKSVADTSGKLFFNTSGRAGYTEGHRWYEYVYLFPNGLYNDKRLYRDYTYNFFAVPPTPQFAFMRSSDYNHLYYNPKVNYTPWIAASINGSKQSFANANPTAARSHPLLPLSSTPHTLDLTHTYFSTSSNKTFRMRAGMAIPGSTVSGIKAYYNSRWNTIGSDVTVPNGSTWSVAIPYYPATYYVKDETCTSGPDCVQGPDGKQLHRYEIKPDNTFPSGRNYQHEMQNFANWYTYYRKRKLMLSAVSGQVLSRFKYIRAGLVPFLKPAPVTMYDFNSADSSKNWEALLGKIYLTSRSGTTPTRAALDYTGRQFQTNSNIIQSACQINAAMVLTDGFAITSGPTPPSYNAATWGSGQPYTHIYTNSLADIALSYYTANLQPSLSTGLVPTSSDTTSPNADKNPDLHMNTFAMSMSTKGNIYGNDMASTTDPFIHSPLWPNPNISRSQAAIDDLWHATINGRGMMFDGKDPITVMSGMYNLLLEIMSKTNSQSPIGLRSAYINTNNNAVYTTNQNIRYGNLIKSQLSITNGAIAISKILWETTNQYDAMDPDTRLIATYNGSSGIPFRWSSLPSTMKTQLNSSISPPGPNDGETVLKWIRGDKSIDAKYYRTRKHLLGSMVHAGPLVVKGASGNYSEHDYGSFRSSINSRSEMVYQAANDGMLHAFNAESGQELWSYIPKLIYPKLNLFASFAYGQQFMLDETPIVSDVYNGSHWETLLVGGLGAAGGGFYALDITHPNASNETSVAGKVKWEFPSDSTPSSIKNNIGYSVGKPIIAKTKAAGWVVIVSSGYDNRQGDGKGHLFILNANTGALLREIHTSAGTSSNPSGLAHLAAYSANKQYDPLIDYVYGGDLLGNVWRFDLSGDSISKWNVNKLAALVDSDGEPQPITTQPELTNIDNKRIVFVGTGRMLRDSDYSSTEKQTLYSLLDDQTSTPMINPLRSNLRSLDNLSDKGTHGWYLDLQTAGERISSSPVLVRGKLVLNVNKPSPSTCSTASFQYIVSLFQSNQYHEKSLEIPTYERAYKGTNLASEPVLVVLPDDDTVLAITHMSDNTIDTTQVIAPLPPTVKPVAWREVIRD